VFAEALQDILGRLETARQQGLLRGYALVGGLAVAAHQVPRATRDIDFVVALAGATPVEVANLLQATYRPGEPDDPLVGVFELRISTAYLPIPVQLLLLPSPWSEVVLEGVEELNLAGQAVPVATWDRLLLLKLYAGGPTDILDAQGLWAAARPDSDTVEKLGKLAKRVGLGTEFVAFLAQQGRTPE